MAPKRRRETTLGPFAGLYSSKRSGEWLAWYSWGDTSTTAASHGMHSCFGRSIMVIALHPGASDELHLLALGLAFEPVEDAGGEATAALEQGLLPWSLMPDVTVDRFDARLLLHDMSALAPAPAARCVLPPALALQACWHACVRPVCGLGDCFTLLEAALRFPAKEHARMCACAGKVRRMTRKMTQRCTRSAMATWRQLRSSCGTAAPLLAPVGPLPLLML